MAAAASEPTAEDVAISMLPHIRNIDHTKWTLPILLTSIAGVSFGVAALALPQWFTMDTPSAHHRLGLFQQCLLNGYGSTSLLTCSAHAFTPFCGNTSDDIRSRRLSAMVLAVMAVFLMFVSAGLVILGWCVMTVKPQAYLAIPMAASIVMAISISIYVNTEDAFYWCGRSFCEYYAATIGGSGKFCDAGLGISFAFAMVFIFLCVVSATIASSYFRAMVEGKVVFEVPPEEPPEPVPGADLPIDHQKSRVPSVAVTSVHVAPAGQAVSGPAARQRTRASSAAVASTAAAGGGRLNGDTRSRGSHGGPTARTQRYPRSSEEPPMTTTMDEAGDEEADWVLDPRTGMYWSASNQLFLDARRRMYYDPVASMWYDPGTKAWIPAASADEGY